MVLNFAPNLFLIYIEINETLLSCFLGILWGLKNLVVIFFINCLLFSFGESRSESGDSRVILYLLFYLLEIATETFAQFGFFFTINCFLILIGLSGIILNEESFFVIERGLC